MDNGNLIEYIREKAKLELHIVNSDKRYDLYKSIQGNVTEDILRQLCTILEKTKQDTKTFSEYILKFHSACAEFSKQLPLLTNTQDMNLHELQHIFNFYVQCVFIFFQDKVIAENKGDPDEVKQTTGPKTCTTERSSETERGLFAIGGGTIGEIWKVNKRRRTLKTITESQRTMANNLYKMTLEMRMTTTEKERENLPKSTRERDSGGLFLPKRRFLPFIKTINEGVMEYANEESYKKYGKNLIKVCVVGVRSRVDIPGLFDVAAKSVFADVKVQKDVLEEFRQTWIRKIVHARLNEFIRGHNQMMSQACNSRYKGGQTLRDELFAVTKKQSSKFKEKSTNKSNAKKVKRSSKCKENTTKKYNAKTVLKSITKKNSKATRDLTGKKSETLNTNKVKTGKKRRISQPLNEAFDEEFDDYLRLLSVNDDKCTQDGRQHGKRKRFKSRRLLDFEVQI